MKGRLKSDREFSANCGGCGDFWDSHGDARSYRAAEDCLRQAGWSKTHYRGWCCPKCLTTPGFPYVTVGDDEEQDQARKTWPKILNKANAMILVDPESLTLDNCPTCSAKRLLGPSWDCNDPAGCWIWREAP